MSRINQNLISVIIPVYNVENYLDRCITSVIDQTYKNLEILLVNDGSTDKSGEICDNYAQQDKRIKVIHKKNGGLSSARNAGLDIAKGDFIGFLDSDDFIALEYYEILFKILAESNSDLSFCSFQRFYNYDELKKIDLNNYTIDIFLNTKIFDDFYNKSNFVENVIVWNKLYKKEIWNSLRFPIGRFHEDEFICHEIFFLSQKIAKVDLKMYYYLQREGSIMSNNNYLEKFIDILDSNNLRLQFSKRNNLPKLYNDTLKLRYRRLNNIYQLIPYEKLTPSIQSEIKKSWIHFSLKDKLKVAIFYCTNLLKLKK